MSYQTAPKMTADDDVLFRAAITTINDDGLVFKSYIGPYTKLGPARAAVTRTRNRYKNYYPKTNATVELEACMPEWKVVE